MALNVHDLKIYTREKIRKISETEYNSLRETEKAARDLKYVKETVDGVNKFYEYQVPTSDELDTALLYKLCKSQDETNKHLKVIKGVLIFFAALTIIGMIATVVLLNK